MDTKPTHTTPPHAWPCSRHSHDKYTGLRYRPNGRIETNPLCETGFRFFRTGDLGRMEDDTYLRITGRIKEQYKLENGKYVVPGPIEAAMTSSTYITQVRLLVSSGPVALPSHSTERGTNSACGCRSPCRIQSSKTRRCPQLSHPSGWSHRGGIKSAERTDE